MKNKKNKTILLKDNRGIVLFYVIFLLSISLSIIFGITTLIVKQEKGLRKTGDHIIAYYAAETGIEQELHRQKDLEQITPTSYQGILSNGARYLIDVTTSPSTICNNQYPCIKSTGVYKDTKRSIFIKR